MRWMALALAGILAVSAAQARKPSPPALAENPAHLFGPDQYPADALKARQEGRVVVILTLSPAGEVTDCRVSVSAGVASLDAVTCAQARRAVFRPARDAKGRAVVSAFTLPVRWVLPSASPLANDRLVIQATVEPSGAMRDCVVDAMLGAAVDPRDICPALARTFHDMAAGATGDSTVKRVDMMMIVETIVEGQAPLAERLLDGMTLIMKTILDFDVLADGTPVNCRNTAVFAEGSDDDLSMCDGSTRFAPSDRTRHVRRVLRAAYRTPSE